MSLDKDFLNRPQHEQLQYWQDRLLRSIPMGQFSNTLLQMLTYYQVNYYTKGYDTAMEEYDPLKLRGTFK